MPLNPFDRREYELSGPAIDIVPITPSDSTILDPVPVGLYVTGAGTIVIETVSNNVRTLTVPVFFYLPVGVRRVLAATTATGIHGLIVI